MSDWGTPVIMLGKTHPRAASTGGSGLAKANPGAEPVDWPFLLGSYAGSIAGGAAVGYLVGRDGRSTQAGALAASGLWGVSETVAFARDRHPILSGTFLALGLGSLAYVWLRR